MQHPTLESHLTFTELVYCLSSVGAGVLVLRKSLLVGEVPAAGTGQDWLELVIPLVVAARTLSRLRFNLGPTLPSLTWPFCSSPLSVPGTLHRCTTHAEQEVSQLVDVVLR